MSKNEKLVDLLEQIEFFEGTLEAMEGISPEEEQAKVREMLEAAEGKIEDKLLGVARWRRQLELEAKEVLGGEISRLQGRQRSQRRRADSLKAYLEFGLGKIEGE